MVLLNVSRHSRDRQMGRGSGRQDEAAAALATCVRIVARQAVVPVSLIGTSAGIHKGPSTTFDTSNDPEVIDSMNSGSVTRDGVTIGLCVYRLEHTKWKREVVDAEGTSFVRADEFETDDAALTELNRKVAENGMPEFHPTRSKALN